MLQSVEGLEPRMGSETILFLLLPLQKPTEAKNKDCSIDRTSICIDFEFVLPMVPKITGSSPFEIAGSFRCHFRSFANQLLGRAI